MTTQITNLPIAALHTADLPDLGAVTDASSFVGDLAGSGRFLGSALRDYLIAAVNAQYHTANVRQYGAIGNGIANDTAAINTALATGLPVYFPPGTYNTTGGHTVAANGQAVFGCVADQCIIKCTTTGGAIFITGAHTTGVTYRDLKLTRSAIAVAGAYGINASATHSRGLIENVYVEKQWVGVVLGSTDMSWMRRSIMAQNLSHGVLITNPGPDTGFQWTLESVLSQLNDGDGFCVSPVASAGAGGCSLGDWIGCSTYANTGFGAHIDATSATPVNDMRILGGFFGNDGAGGIVCNTYGTLNAIYNALVELAGIGSTGSSQITPASNNAHGIQITPNNNNVQIVGVRVNGNSLAGIVTSANEMLISGAYVTNNGQALGAARYGIGLLAGRAMVNGCRIGNTAGASQNYGIDIADGSQAAIVGCDMSNNATAATFITANGDHLTLVGNLPFGTNTILPAGGVVVGLATGGATAGTINVSAGLLKNNTAYTNP